MEAVSVVAELEGALLRDGDLFPYFMLVAFEASGLIRFTLLLLLWPLLPGLRVMAVAAIAGVPVAEVEAVARAVLPKFFLDELDAAAWQVFGLAERRVVVTAMPRVMVEWFAREHLGAEAVVGAELEVSHFGFTFGLLKRKSLSVADQVRALFNDGEGPPLGSAERELRPFFIYAREVPRPKPVIFHDGRLVPRPTPLTALLIVLWIPLGIIAALVRMLVGIVVPLRFHPHLARAFGGDLVVRGRPPAAATETTSGVLFVCTHRSLLDPVVLSTVLGCNVPAVTYSISRLSEILSPIPTVRLSRDRKVDADRIKAELARGDLVVCPEGTTCREPFLLRFSALFAELTDRIVPVAMNCKVGLFHASTARGWKALDPIFFFMNPRPIYEVTFLEQLPPEATCAAGKSPHEVANHVQKILAAALGYECTTFTRKDKYGVLAGNDGTVKPFSLASAPGGGWRGLGMGLLHRRGLDRGPLSLH
ncbi:unnamed protein product [Spirodela intermedia]|uniref:Phospholipid/glycerol acyltransferase domain-containing protein n=1 Tax=Spirodela intermedia TaxID=51605 RepID=A0A7I8IV99_SPIIN|nr:unnamed protein product [Spirodela intermedia]CAA6661738.1 unnamed protein product [Spirodela intermedia]